MDGPNIIVYVRATSGNGNWYVGCAFIPMGLILTNVIYICFWDNSERNLQVEKSRTRYIHPLMLWRQTGWEDILSIVCFLLFRLFICKCISAVFACETGIVFFGSMVLAHTWFIHSVKFDPRRQRQRAVTKAREASFAQTTRTAICKASRCVEAAWSVARWAWRGSTESEQGK